MAQAASITVKPNGQTLVVNFTGQGSAVSFYSDAALTASVTLPYTVTADTTFYTGNFGQYTISVKQPDGTELDGSSRRVQPDVPVVVEPLPTGAQVAADVGYRSSMLMPTGAIAETWPRHIGGAGAAFATTSGQLWLTAIQLKSGDVCTSATFVSDSTAGVSLTNQWFALYDSSRNLIRQTSDDTTTAWAANTSKTLNFSTTYTVTASGLYYLGIMVAAATVPTFENIRIVTNLSGLAPKLSGTSTGSLTTTAPATAAAITHSTVSLYGYIS